MYFFVWWNIWRCRCYSEKTEIFAIQWLKRPPSAFLLSSSLLPSLSLFFLLQCKTLELKLEEERVFTEYEQVPKKRTNCVLTTATLPENAERNRFRDVVPYEENRVELVPNKENNTGYINASHIKVMLSLIHQWSSGCESTDWDSLCRLKDFHS